MGVLFLNDSLLLLSSAPGKWGRAKGLTAVREGERSLEGLGSAPELGPRALFLPDGLFRTRFLSGDVNHCYTAVVDILPEKSRFHLSTKDSAPIVG